MGKRVTRLLLGAFVTASVAFAPSVPSLILHVDAPITRGSAIRAAIPLPVTCDGDGHSGRRIQFLYGYLRGGRNRLAQVRSFLQTRAAQVDDIYANSAGGARHLRVEHDGSCFADIKAVALSSGALAGQLGKTNAEIAAKGFRRTDRKYIVFSEVASRQFGGIAFATNDETPTAYNDANQQRLIGLISRGFPGTPTAFWWSEIATAHEIGHTLGAVQPQAPNATNRFHCTDGADVMCYPDGSAQAVNYSATVCPGANAELDCNDDDYYSVAPTGAYLPTHWNVANSQYLIGAPVGPPNDLAASWSAAALQVTTSGLFFKGTLDLTNNAVDPTLSSVVEYYLSADAVFDAADQRLSAVTNVGTLVQFQSFGFDVRFRLPAPAVRLNKFLIAVADGSSVLNEAVRTNNVAVALQINR
jgi:hypothetical protein